jgi:transcription elongation GreA/GreB family factor
MYVHEYACMCLIHDVSSHTELKNIRQHVLCLLETQADYDSSQEQLHDCQRRLSQLQEKHQRQTLELEAQLREQAAAAQQDKLQQVAAVKAQLER